MNQEVKIVIGSAHGDEGKGVTVQHLCKEAIGEGKKPLVIRFSGGPQAGHTINYNGIEHICSTYGAGVLMGVPTLVYHTAYFDPLCAKREHDALVKKMTHVPNLYVCEGVRCITPFDVLCGRGDVKVLSDGTCGKGIFPTFKRHNDGFTTNLSSFTLNGWLTSIKYYYKELVGMDDETLNEAERLSEEECFMFSKPDFGFIKMVSDYDKFLSGFDVLIFEGSQGLLLDMDCGFYPHVTPSKVGLNGLEGKYVKKSFLQDAEVYFVTRTYLTRHGNGYEPCKRYFDCLDIKDKHETNVLNTYQGEFKTGIINFDLLNEAYLRHNVDNKIRLYNMTANLVVTHWDILDKGNEFPYIQNGKVQIAKYEDKSELYNLFYYFCNTFQFKKMFINDSIESNHKEVI